MWMWNLLAKITCQFKPCFQLRVNLKLSNHVTSDDRHVLNTYLVPGRRYQYSINKVQRSEIMTHHVQSFRSLAKLRQDLTLTWSASWLDLIWRSGWLAVSHLLVIPSHCVNKQCMKFMAQHHIIIRVALQQYLRLELLIWFLDFYSL